MMKSHLNLYSFLSSLENGFMGEGNQNIVVGKKVSESHVIVHENAFAHIPLDLYPWSIAIQKGQFRYQYQVPSQLGNLFLWLLKDHPSNV